MAITHSVDARDVKEFRRLRAWELKQEGWTQESIAQALGVTAGAVSQWCKAAGQGGVQALLSRKAPGPVGKLTDQQKAQIPELLEKGAEHYGFEGQRWTCKRVGTVIWEHFGVRYHHSHISRILLDLGWSPQKPAHYSSARNEEAIEKWKDERWPDIKKKQTKSNEP